MQRALDTFFIAARSEAPIMLRAELGSDVATVARLGHHQSGRGDSPFLSLCCPSLSTLPAQALLTFKGGTVFLDEVGELAPRLQAGLVQLLDTLGAQGATPRVISATRHDLDEAVRCGCFREELFFRLNVVEIRIPPLRERPEDVLRLVHTLIASLSVELGRRAPILSDDAAAMLLRYRWPANVRELKNTIERALLTWPADVIGPEAFPRISAEVSGGPCVGDQVSLRELEREHIRRIMARAGSLKAAAAILGMDETTLWRRRKLYQRERDAKLGSGR